MSSNIAAKPLGSESVPVALSQPEALHRVVVIGAGFGGLEAAQHLARVPGLIVTVLDRHKYHLFQPPLYQVATTALSPNDIASSIRAVFAREQQVDVLMEEVTGIDLVTRHVLCH